uniref:Endosome-associated-trafficking regulator 1 n=1 Tax=Monopterus albus TaxID=43700 RepID=A0A3Q3IFE4_MONAL|nr:serologically defined colon cancer antigen 3 isoform X3 [Monopterus albus]
MSKHRNCAKTLIIADDEEVGAEELNPFSFREFLRWKEQDQDQEEDQDQTLSKEEEEEEWGRSFQSGIGNTSSLCAEDEEKETWFISKPDVQRGGGGGGENYEGDDETSMAEPVASCRGRSCQVQQLQEENLLLRRTVSELQRRSDADEHRLSELSEELQQRRRQEEKEAQDLEGMVHSVEQNLHLMTKRAVKAENSVSKMKVELQQLQVEVNSLRAENDRLKAAESQVVMTMRQNVQVASEYLNKMSCHAHSSIRQLLEEAETLRLVCQLLQSIDKISNLSTEA